MDNIKIQTEPAAEDTKGRCMDCTYFESRHESDGYADWVRGRCHKTGLSIVPPLHTCPCWVERTDWKGGEE